MIPSSHPALLFVLLAVSGGIAWQLARLLRRGAMNAHMTRSGQVHAWKELGGPGQNARSSKELCWTLVAELVSRIAWLREIRSRSLRVKMESLMDPIDGTGFAPGETILRCTCGTAYHADSWPWLQENNASRCVGCKKAGQIHVSSGKRPRFSSWLPENSG